tara:strand:+ start:164 stop:1849 length:1686 start_codon:yes stop_codon:yes gene_type:complete
MINTVIFIISFYILLFSTIGYGFIFNHLCFERKENFDERNLIYIGFYGLFLITLISLLSSLVIAHNFTHNIIIHALGIIFLFLFKNKKKIYLKQIFYISIFVISALIISKTHDDFSYYHLPFTKYLTEHKVIFGMGNLNHGYKFLSSLFFLNSVFYLPLIEYFSFHFTLGFVLIFFNYFILREIYIAKNNEVIKYLYIFAFVFFNLSFNRIAEYGTDKIGQLLITLLIIKLFSIVCYNNKQLNLNRILYIVPLLALCISLKSYFLPYILLGFTILLLNKKISEILSEIILSKSFLFFLVLLSAYYFHHFISTGCIISPISTTCFGEKFSWAIKKDEMLKLSIFLEQWAKAGAGPNFRVENVSIYIQNFNWLPNWFEKYFLEKFIDQLGILIVTFIFIFFLFKKFEFKKKNKILNLRIIFFYFLILLVFVIWLTNHPTLRYGGYPMIFLTLSIPISLFFSSIKNKNNFDNKVTFIILLVVVAFNIKNLTRINSEFERNDQYKFSNFPFFAIVNKDFVKKEYDSGLNIYGAHHCWSTPTPCGHISNKIYVYKRNGFYFINKSE